MDIAGGLTGWWITAWEIDRDLVGGDRWIEVVD